MNRTLSVVLSLSLLTAPMAKATGDVWSERDVREAIWTATLGGIFLAGPITAGAYEVYTHQYLSVSECSTWMLASGIIAGTLAYIGGSGQTAPAIYRYATSLIPLTERTRELLKLAEVIEFNGEAAYIAKLNPYYNHLWFFNEYMEYRNKLSEALKQFKRIEQYEDVAYLINMVKCRIALIDRALTAIKNVPTFPYPMTLPLPSYHHSVQRDY